MDASLIELIKTNLTHVGFAMLIFLGAYLSNMIFSLFLNIGLIKEAFDLGKFLQSIVKAIVFLVGLALLVVTLTVIPVFAELMSWAIPDEFIEMFSGLVIISIVLYVSCRYAFEALAKVKEILDYKK